MWAIENNFLETYGVYNTLEEAMSNLPQPYDCNGGEISYQICSISMNGDLEDPDEAYERAVEYYLNMESLSFQWEQACRDDPELLDK